MWRNPRPMSHSNPLDVHCISGLGLCSSELFNFINQRSYVRVEPFHAGAHARICALETPSSAETNLRNYSIANQLNRNRSSFALVQSIDWCKSVLPEYQQHGQLSCRLRRCSQRIAALSHWLLSRRIRLINYCLKRSWIQFAWIFAEIRETREIRTMKFIFIR